MPPCSAPRCRAAAATACVRAAVAAAVGSRCRRCCVLGVAGVRRASLPASASPAAARTRPTRAARLGEGPRRRPVSTSEGPGGPDDGPRVPAPDGGSPRPREEVESAVLEGVRGPKPGDRVVVAMSGGVDSSLAAWLLHKHHSPGVNLCGVYMHNWNALEEDGLSNCPSDANWRDVQSAGRALEARTPSSAGSFPCHRLDLSREYWVRVFAPLLRAYESGLTPNPDIGCNREVKFGVLWDQVMGGKFDARPVSVGTGEAAARRPRTWLATGHYARVGEGGQLHRAYDRKKDQSFFLAGVPSDRLSKVLFPLAHLTKSEVRLLAAEAELPTARKRESMGICFVGKKRSFRDFLGQFIKTEPGEILTLDGRRVGEHDGAALYTEGQCARLAIGTSKWFIAGKDVKRNRLFVAPKGHESLEVTEFYTKNVCWSCSKEGKPADEALESANGCSQNDRLHVQFRNATDAVPCSINRSPSNPGEFRIRLHEPWRMIAPGQHAVLYLGDRCLGTAQIDRVVFPCRFPD